MSPSRPYTDALLGYGHMPSTMHCCLVLHCMHSCHLLMAVDKTFQHAPHSWGRVIHGQLVHFKQCILAAEILRSLCHVGCQQRAPVPAFIPCPIALRVSADSSISHVSDAMQVKSPPKAFEEVVKTHFRLNKDKILETNKVWADEGGSKDTKLLADINSEFQKL